MKCQKNVHPSISILVPVYNEQEVVRQVITSIIEWKNQYKGLCEIIVINDGSTDNSKDILEESQEILLINHLQNKGYGASLKTGEKISKHEWLLFFDSDGQHNTESINILIENVDHYDMVIGARQSYQGPLSRQPGKYFIKKISEYAVGEKIPDFNSGLRLVNRKKFDQFRHLYPQGFSLSTTLTLAFLKQGYYVNFVPIEVSQRIGKSAVGVLDGFQAIKLVFRIIMIFSPLRFFLPSSMIIFFFSIISISIDIYRTNITDTTLVLFLTSIIIGSFGLLADQISCIRREIRDLKQ